GAEAFACPAGICGTGPFTGAAGVGVFPFVSTICGSIEFGSGREALVPVGGAGAFACVAGGADAGTCVVDGAGAFACVSGSFVLDCSARWSWKFEPPGSELSEEPRAWGVSRNRNASPAYGDMFSNVTPEGSTLRTNACPAPDRPALFQNGLQFGPNQMPVKKVSCAGRHVEISTESASASPAFIGSLPG